MRIGVGAAVVVVLLTLVCAVLVSIMTPHGRTDTIALAAANGARVVGPTDSASATPNSTAAGTATATGSGTSTVAATPGTGPGDPTGKASSTSPTSAAQAGAVVVIHILGSVVRPGLYQLTAGARVVDAVAAAGGFSANADQGQQNLARVVKDGEQIVVPEVGAAPPLGSAASVGAGAGAGAGGGVGAPAGGAAGVPAAPVNINTADETTLETLPHVGPQMGARIIAWRTENGPFTQVDDLKNVSGIGDKTFAELQPLVTV
ncbi:MAG: hypothetical protein JWQ64_2607 [Subtercola sp.]|nr:hypothetical protein [Subtercola sp.]